MRAERGNLLNCRYVGTLWFTNFKDLPRRGELAESTPRNDDPFVLLILLILFLPLILFTCYTTTMPKFAAQHLLSSPLDTPELPPGDPNLLPAADQSPPDDEYDPVRQLLTWNAPARPHMSRGRSFYTTVATLIILLSCIALFFQEWLLIGAMIAFGFLVYVLNFIAPGDIAYRLSTQGITIGEHFYHWDELDSFWFEKKGDQHLMYVLTRFRFPGMLIMVLGENNQEQVKRIAAMYLPFREIVPKSTMDKWSDALQRYFYIENPSK